MQVSLILVGTACDGTSLTFIPAAGLAAGAGGSFWVTDIDLVNAGAGIMTYEFWWLPRGEDDDFRANLGCQNGTDGDITIEYEGFDDAGISLESDAMDLAAYSNDQINRFFRLHSPVNGFVDVWSDSPGAAFFCYGSVVDNQTGDPTTILPQ